MLIQKFSSSVLTFLILVFLSTIFYHCASEGAPSGGPKDETGPGLMRTSPANGETLVDTGTTILFEFSEPVNYKSVENSLTIFPSPDEKPTIRINRNKVRIIPKEKLKPGTTYIFTFGRKVEDYQKNITDDEVKLAFSTGKTIDNNTVSGKLFDYRDEKQTAYILFYVQDGKNLDSLIDYDPDYYTPVDKKGHYRATNLAKGKYSVIAYQGSFKKKPRFSESDFTAAGFDENIILESGSDTLEHVHLRLHQYPLRDFTMEKAYEEERAIHVLFSHPIDIEKSKIEVKFDGMSLEKHWYFDDKNPNTLVLVPLLDSAGYGVEISDLVDIYGRSLVAITDTLVWSNPEVVDTLGPKAKFLLSGAEAVLPGEPIILQFSEPVRLPEKFKDRIILSDQDSNSVDYFVEQIDLTKYRIRPLDELEYFRKYHLGACLDSVVDLSNNACQDSLVQMEFTTIDENVFGSISGTIDTQLDVDKIIFGCEKTDQKERVYMTRAREDGTFHVEKVLPGDYKIFVFYDENSNDQYDWGSLVPYRPAEKYRDYPKPVTVRSRWETERLEIQF
ncbi:MAG: Ig-like domain-containing protein [Candidatus Marinimicrobia bacterium]|nr:Ig-like domain-containing protein [Candidatus Neomarinimicrobiota bacterium]